MSQQQAAPTAAKLWQAVREARESWWQACSDGADKDTIETARREFIRARMRAENEEPKP